MPQLKPKPFMYDPVDEPALNRLRAEGGNWSWNVMNWFVLLAKKDLTQLSDGDFLILQEEALAIRRTFCKDLGAKLPAREELSRLQRDIRKYLHDLVVRHDATLGPFPLKIEINLPKTRDEHDRREGGWISHMVGDTGPSTLTRITVRHRVDRTQNLQYEFARRLETYADAIKQCPRCSTIFLQLRATAKYCSRVCQSRAVMKRARADAKMKAELKKTRKKHRAASAKGGKHHGK